MIYPLICPLCGEIELTREQYLRQLSNPDAFWYCPRCMNGAEWDDVRYEEENVIEPSEWEREEMR